MIFVPIFGSEIGKIFQPFFEAVADLVAFFYAIIPNYTIAIALLTICIMAITAPLTIKGTKSMAAMQRLQPEMKKLQAKYKNDKVKLNEEMMALYSEHGVSPIGGCLPQFLQMPIMLFLYGVIRGLANTYKLHGKLYAGPRYISKDTKIYQNLSAHPGEIKSFGLNLATTVFSHHESWVGAIPYAGLVAIATGLQYFQMRQMNKRNPGAQANPQMQMMQRYMPLVFIYIYVKIAAGVNIYFIVSALCRIGIQYWVFRKGLTVAPAKADLPGAGGGSGGKPRKRTMMERIADMQQQALQQQQARERALTDGVVPELGEDGDSESSGKFGSSSSRGKTEPKPGVGGTGIKRARGSGSSNGNSNNNSKTANGKANASKPVTGSKSTNGANSKQSNGSGSGNGTNSNRQNRGNQQSRRPAGGSGKGNN